jgi:hypothetical protein
MVAVTVLTAMCRNVFPYSLIIKLLIFKWIMMPYSKYQNSNI